MTPHIHMEDVEIQAGYRNWADFTEKVLERYNYNGCLRLLRKDFMDWVNSPDKGQNASTLLQEFELRFAQHSRFDQTVSKRARSYFSLHHSIRASEKAWVFFLKQTTVSRLTGRPSKKYAVGLTNTETGKEKGSSPSRPAAEIRAKPTPSRMEELRR